MFFELPRVSPYIITCGSYFHRNFRRQKLFTQDVNADVDAVFNSSNHEKWPTPLAHGTLFDDACILEDAFGVVSRSHCRELKRFAKQCMLVCYNYYQSGRVYSSHLAQKKNTE